MHSYRRGWESHPPLACWHCFSFCCSSRSRFFWLPAFNCHGVWAQDGSGLREFTREIQIRRRLLETPHPKGSYIRICWLIPCPAPRKLQMLCCQDPGARFGFSDGKKDLADHESQQQNMSCPPVPSYHYRISANCRRAFLSSPCNRDLSHSPETTHTSLVVNIGCLFGFTRSKT